MSDTTQDILRGDVPPTEPLKRPRTLTEQAADAIRSRIINGDFQLGEALSEITLATDLGVSKTPIREAFLQLKNEGLVDIQPQRGTFVFQMSGEQIGQLASFRELLEAEALRIAMRQNPEGLGDTLSQLVPLMTDSVERGDYRRYRQLDNIFHKQIIAASRNPFLEAAYQGIAFRVQALRNRLSLEPEFNRRSQDEHREILKLVGAGQAEEAVAKLAEHVRNTSQDYVTYFDRSAGRRAGFTLR